MPYFEFMMLIDDWIDEIEEEKKADKKRREESERERKKMESANKKSQNHRKPKSPSIPRGMKPKFK